MAPPSGPHLLPTSSSSSSTRYRTLSPYSSHNGEADDERSSFSSYPVMGPTTLVPAYPGEDNRPTSRRELLGFYAYSFAGEVYVVCGLGAFIPMILEDLARGSATAVLASDHTKPCRQSTLLPPTEHEHHGSQCVFRLFGSDINTASFAMYTFSISVLLQALVVVTMSGAADHGQYRKTLLMGFAVTGAVATMLFLPVTPAVYLLGSLWAIIGNVCFGASFVLLNSMLPLLVRHHPALHNEELPLDDDIREDNGEHGPMHNEPSIDDGLDSTTPLLLPEEDIVPQSLSRPTLSREMQLSTQISAYGTGIGYSAAIIVQLLSLAILATTGASLFSLRLVMFVIGLWWLCFTIPASMWLRPRPGPPLRFAKGNGRARTYLAYVTHSWKTLGRTIIRARRLRDILLFLAAWFMISDAIATVSGTAILFAKTTLGMEPSALALINVVVTLCGIVGAFAWSKISHMAQLKPNHTILACICLFELIPLYGLLGYVPAIRRSGMFGLQQPWEMYPLGAVYGLVLGGLSSYCRSLFGELIPAGNEAAFYALFAITDKGSSIFGPAIVGAITQRMGDIRPAFWFLAVLIGLPIPLMFLVDVDRGKREAAALARETAPSIEAITDSDTDDFDTSAV